MCRWMNYTHNKNSHNASYGPLTLNTGIKHSKTETNTHTHIHYTVIMGMLLPDRSGGNLSEVLNIASVPFQRDTVDTCHTHAGFRRPSCSSLHLKLQSKREGAKMKECYAWKRALILYQSICLTTWRSAQRQFKRKHIADILYIL